MPWSLAAALNILSGALMAGLGIMLFAANPRKDWNRIFSILAVFWGAQIVAVNSVRVVTTENAARLAGEIGLAFLLPLAFFVASFAAVFPKPRLARSALPILALLAPSLVALGLLFFDTEALLAGVSRDAAGGFTMEWGPAFAPLVVAPLYASFFFVLFAMMRRYQEADSPLARKQIALVLAAFGIFVAYNVPVQLYLFGAGARAADVGAWVIAAIMSAAALLLIVLGARLWRSRADADARRVLGALAASAAAGLATAGVLAVGGPRIDLLGVARIASVALVVYAIARYQLFDIDLRVKVAATTLAALLAAVALGAAAWVALRGVPLTGALGGALVAVAALVAFVPFFRIAGRLADRLVPQVSREGEHLYLRKLEVYRAGVEAGSDEGRLAELRAKLGLSQRDHDLVVNMAMARAQTEVAAAPDLRPGGVVFGKYAIERVIGEGGYGRVFLARDRILERHVVIKELQARWRGDPNVMKTFLREAQIAGRLNHPNIVSVLEVERHGEDHYIVMEHLAGGTLEDKLRTGTLPPPDAVRIARAILAALDAAHAQGVVHRDVKPANVLLGSQGEVKLTDFGIAQMGADDPQRTISGLTSRGPAPGTLQYMSPEQASGAPLDARSDLYAVGALLYRMLAGRPHLVLAGLDELAARARISAAPAPPPPEGVPRRLGAEVARALAPAPADRHRGAREMADALAQAVLNPAVERS